MPFLPFPYLPHHQVTFYIFANWINNFCQGKVHRKKERKNRQMSVLPLHLPTYSKNRHFSFFPPICHKMRQKFCRLLAFFSHFYPICQLLVLVKDTCIFKVCWGGKEEERRKSFHFTIFGLHVNTSTLVRTFASFFLILFINFSLTSRLLFSCGNHFRELLAEQVC